MRGSITCADDAVPAIGCKRNGLAVICEWEDLHAVYNALADDDAGYVVAV